MSFASALDARLEAFFRRARRWPAIDPVALGLATHRRGTARLLERTYGAELARLSDRVVARDPRAIALFDETVATMIERMRAARPDGVRSLLGAIDRVLYRDAPEMIDDPAFPRDERVHVLDVLDRMNAHMGSYDRWIDLAHEIVGVAESRGAKPVRIHELAAGHGGFAIALKERLGARVAVTASDVKPEYLELGRQRAEERGVDVRFVLQDATRLEGVKDVDVFLCTQSVHHFPPGMVARMIGEAARAAKTAACFIDAERGVVPIVLMGPAMAAYGRSWPVFHDTVVSLRRMYFEEELALLARVAPSLPSSATVDSGRFGPGHAFVRVTLRG